MDNGQHPDVEVVHINPESVRMSPQAMRMLTVATGRTMEQLMQSEESADKFQAMAFIQLRRRHPDLGPAELWDLAGDTDIEMGAETADPFATGSATAGLPSPATGGSTPTPSTT